MSSHVVRVVAAMVVDDRGRLLAARRPAGKRLAGLWELPGGKVDPGESDQVALARELAEELGLRAEVGRRVAVATHTYDFGTVELHAYLCSTSDTPRAIEHSELRWLDSGEVFSVEWAPADVPILVEWIGCPR